MRGQSSWVTVLAVTWLGLSACSDTQTGVFVDGPVVGLHYQTLTRSGLTNGKGEFAYEEGETVTFTVGGVVLGTTKAKDRLSPFDLFGMAPPTDALELRQLLRDNVITDFDRAANIALFLQALDADRDPSNGIDVTNWGATLAGVPFSFDEDFADFAFGWFQRFAAAYPGVHRHIDVASVLPHLYATLGLTVMSQVPVTHVVDYGNDGINDVTNTLTVDDLGRVIRIRGDSNGNGVVDRDDSTTYDPRGLIAGYDYRRDSGEDGVFERVESYAYVFDDDGNVTSSVVQDTTHGVVGLKQSFTSTYDIAGNLLATLQENDNGGNGSVESSRKETYTYDLGGRLLTSRFETDTDGDGAANDITSESRTWSADGFLAQTVTELDGDVDGVADSRQSMVYTRDLAGRALTQAAELHVGDAVILRSQRMFTYDAQGNLLADAYEEDSDANGTIDYRSTRTATYLADGRLLDEVTTTDGDADGTPNSQSTTLRTYDAAFNLIGEITERDANGDGVIDSRITNERSYDPFGNLLTRLARADTNNDGVVDSQTLETTTYSDIADGLYELVYDIVIN